MFDLQDSEYEVLTQDEMHLVVGCKVYLHDDKSRFSKIWSNFLFISSNVFKFWPIF